MSAAFGELRSIAQREPGEDSWVHLCALLDRAPEHEVVEVLVPYLQDTLDRWPDATRVVSPVWLNKLAEGAPLPQLTVARSLDLRSMFAGSKLVGALGRSHALGHVRQIYASGKRLGPAGVIGLLGHGAFPSLDVLHLDDASLSDTLDALKAEEKAAAAPVEGDAVEGDEAALPVASKWDGVRVDTTKMFNMEPKAPPSNIFGGQIPAQLLAQFSAWDRVPQIGASTALMIDAFKLTKAAPLAKSIYDVSGAKVLVRLKDREDPGKADAEPKKDGEEAPVDPTLELTQQVRSNVIAEVANPSNRTGWMTLFLYPEGDDYGPWVESIYDEAVRDGSIRFNPDQRTSKFLIKSDAIDPTTAIKIDGLGEITPGADEKGAAKPGDKKTEEKKSAPAK